MKRVILACLVFAFLIVAGCSKSTQEVKSDELFVPSTSQTDTLGSSSSGKGL